MANCGPDFFAIAWFLTSSARQSKVDGRTQKHMRRSRIVQQARGQSFFEIKNQGLKGYSSNRSECVPE